jgi:hypothetical protein
MKQILYFALIPLTVAASPAPRHAALTLTTARGVEPFAQCFARAQDRAARPWSFVPKESGGGTFSNVGAAGVRNPYFLEVADRGSTREIRVMPAGDASVIRAVDDCI